MADKKFLDFLDRFDGGGMGQSGEKFEGGGLLSLLGNLMADPYGSEDKARMASRDAFYGAQDIGGPAMSPAPAAMNNNQAAAARPAPPTDAQRFGMNPPAAYSAAPPTDAQRFGMNPPAPYSAAPVNVGAPPSYMQPSSMGMPAPVNAGAPQNPAPEDPLSFEGFTRHLMENYDQGFVRRMLSSPDQYDPAYGLYVRNGGRL